MKGEALGKRFPMVGILLVLSLGLVACGRATPTPFATTTGETAEATTAPQPTDTPEPSWQTFQSPQGLFSIDLPADWHVEERGQTALGVQYALGPEPLGPGPATSMLFVADAGERTAQEAAESLACANGCDEEIALEETTVGAASALRAVLGTAPPLEWYFLSHGDYLVYFSIHDPDTFATREDIIATFAFDEEIVEASTATPTTTATAEPTAPPQVTVEPVRQWQEVVVEEAGITFETPADWSAEQENRWEPGTDSPISLHFQWQQVAPQAAPEDVLDDQLEIEASDPLTLSWGSGISVTARADDSVQRHQVVQVGLRVYDFYVEGPLQETVDAAQPTLDHVVDSVTIQDRLLYLEDPVEAAIDFFRAILRDPTGEEALPYLTAELQEDLASDGDPLRLLGLTQRFHTFNLEWQSESEEQVILDGTLTLVDDSTVAREVHLLFDDAIGWRIAAIESPPDAPADN
ncbi:MAG: hypothetical protein ACOC8X_10390 [Chloroflexota bacterium]